MRHWKMRTPIPCMLLLACFLAQISCAGGGREGSSKAIFNRRFILTIKPMMTYDEIVKIAGSKGAKIGENREAFPPAVEYRWNGERDSVLTVRFSDKKMVEATVLAPNGHTYLIKKSGEIVDSTQ